MQKSSNPWMKSMRRKRKRVAAQELEADKIKIVTAAEAEEKKWSPHGVGIAQQRKAIVDGLAESITELAKPMLAWQKNKSCPSLWPTSIWIPWTLLLLKEIKRSLYQIFQMVWMIIGTLNLGQPSALRRTIRLITLRNLFKPRQRRLAVLRVQPAASFLVCLWFSLSTKSLVTGSFCIVFVKKTKTLIYI